MLTENEQSLLGDRLAATMERVTKLSANPRCEPMFGDELAGSLSHAHKFGGSNMEPDSPFRVGDRVQITEQDTVFRDDFGTVTHVNQQDSRLTIEILVFDRPTPIELDFATANRILQRIEHD